MVMQTRAGKQLISARRTLAPAVAALAVACWGATPAVAAQEPAGKTAAEHIKEYWEKLIAGLESAARATGEEYHKLKDEAARASGPAREKMAAKMEALSKKWAAARARLAAGLETRMHSLGEEAAALEEKAARSSGPAREKMAAELEKLHGQWNAARAKMEAALSSNLKSSREEFEAFKKHAADAGEEARVKLRPHIDHLKAEYRKDRDKLIAYLEADLEKTKEDMEKLRSATSKAAHEAREKLMKKSHELAARIKELTEDRAADDAK
jgi:uncharacterized protein YicC (UPF0701 family)